VKLINISYIYMKTKNIMYNNIFNFILT